MASKEGIKIDLQKVKAVTKCSRLTNVTVTRNFLGLVGYYRVSGRICQRSSSLTNVLKQPTKLGKK